MTAEASEQPGAIEPLRSVLSTLDGVVTMLDACKPVPRQGTSELETLRTVSALAVVNRADDVYTLLYRGTGATVAGALCRGLLEQALINQWIHEAPNRLETLSGALGQERARIMRTIAENDLSVPNWMRWLRPTPVAPESVDGQSQVYPDFQRRLRGPAAVAAGLMLKLPPATADLLAMCGHANYAASMCTAALAPFAIGFEATIPYAAIFAQAAATTGAHSANTWPGDCAVDPTATVEAAAPLHGLPAPPLAGIDLGTPAQIHTSSWEHQVPFLDTNSLLDGALADLLAESIELLALFREAPDPFSGDITVNLTTVLPYLTALGTAEAALLAANGHFSGYTAATAARMLLEEGARYHWQLSAGPDEFLRQRYVAVADAATKGRSDLRRRFADAGTPPEALSALFDALSTPLAIDTRRTPANLRAPVAPPPTEQMLLLGGAFTESGWLRLAYNLLSQVTHSTPLGNLHTIARYRSGQPGNYLLSHEMTALAVDCTAIGAAKILTPLAALLSFSHGVPDSREWRADLGRIVQRIHKKATLIHFLG